MSHLHYSDVWQGIAAAAPDRAAIVDRERTLTWGAFHAESAAIAQHLTDAGLRPGDAVAMLLYNRPEFVTVFWACLATGAAPAGFNYRYRANEVRALLLDSGARILVAPTSLGGVAEEAARGLDVEIIAVDDGGGQIRGATRYEDIVARGGRMPEHAPDGGTLFLYTGGTTGSPKAVVWDLDGLLPARRGTWEQLGFPVPDSVEDAVAIATDPQAPRVVLMPISPLLHGTAQTTTMATLTVGGTVVLASAASVDVEEVYRLIDEQQATRVVVAGDALGLPLAEVAEREHGLPSVRWMTSSGMRFSDDVKRRLHDLGSIEIYDTLSASEGGPFAVGVTRSAADLPARFVLDRNAALLDEDEHEVTLEPGALGILAFRGRLPKGYHGDPVKTAQTFRVIGDHRYIVPGDWARARGDGTIELLGRLSAVVNTGGEKVFPAEVEEVLMQHPSVGDVVVFGLPDARFGEVVSAMIAPRAGAELDPDDVAGFVGERLAGFKKPRHVFLRNSLDRGPTGKVELARVKEDAMRELAVRG